MNTHAEIAFFGGSFTAIPKDQMTAYLSVAAAFCGEGGYDGIRLSTRPDAIDEDILNILKQYSVITIELGTQSMDNEVLIASGRGHRAEDTKQAANMIKAHGFSLVLQMMTGLPKDTAEKSLETAQELIKLKPDGVRMYPTIVVRDTELERLYYQGRYVPMTLDESIVLCAKLLMLFEEADIPVIRLGLHAGEGLGDGSAIVAGPYHPAFRELVENRIFYNHALTEIRELPSRYENILITVPPRCCSKMVGQKGENILRLKQEFGFAEVKVWESGDLKGRQIELQEI